VVPIPAWLAGLTALTLLLAIAEERWGWSERLLIAPSWTYAGVLVALLFAVELFGVLDQQIRFIYFQF
jgi:uncharacterized membrane protein YdcZ (DUF606 family)